MCVDWERPPYGFLDNVNIIPERDVAVVTEMGHDVGYELCAFQVLKGQNNEDLDGFHSGEVGEEANLEQSMSQSQVHNGALFVVVGRCLGHSANDALGKRSSPVGLLVWK